MLQQREFEENKSKRSRIRNDRGDYDGDPHHFQKGDSVSQKRKGDEKELKGSEKDGNKYESKYVEGSKEWLNKDFVDEYAKLAEDENKFNDPWLHSLKTSEYDDTQVVYDVKTKQKSPKNDKMELLYKMPRVELIRMLVAKLDDGQTPSDYLKSHNFKDKKDDNSNCENYHVSDLAHVLTMTWQNVYYLTREDIVEELMSYKNNNKELKQYEFRWEKDDLAVHGPYPHEDILMWVVYGYVSEENPILVRELDSNGVPYTHDWTHYKDSDVYNIFPTNKASESNDEEDLEEEEEDGEESNEDNQDNKDYYGYNTSSSSRENEQNNELDNKNINEQLKYEDDESEDDEDYDDYDDFEEEEGFRTRKKSKLIGITSNKNHQNLDYDQEEPDDEQVY